MSLARTRVVVIGGGRLGGFHLAKLAALPDVELAGVVDTCAHTAAAHGSRWQVPAATCLSQLPGSFDAAIVATPTQTHLAVAGQAMDAGLSVLVEKPLASCPQAARALVEQAARQQRVLQVGHIERFNPAVEVALALAGSPRTFVARRRGPFSGRSTDIDVIFDLMVHDLELAVTLAQGPCCDLRAEGEQVITPLCDVAVARLDFVSGLAAELHAGRACRQVQRTLSIGCQGFTLEVDCHARTVVLCRDGWPPRRAEPMTVPAGDPLSRQDADFIACVRSGRRPRVDGAQALVAVQLAAAVQAAVGPMTPCAAVRVLPTARRSIPGGTAVLSNAAQTI